MLGSCRAFLERNASHGTCFVMPEGDAVLGFVVIEHERFFGLDFLELLFVAQSVRRGGVGEALVQHCISACRTDKLFSSTNLFNAPMHALFRRLGFMTSGMVDNLDPGDPEVIYAKILRP